jgi:aspartate/methionine/tyrosine aminotransferase
MDDEMFTDLALERGVAFLAGRGFGPTPNGERFVRFSFAGDLEKQVKPGAQRLVEVVDSLRS